MTPVEERKKNNNNYTKDIQAPDLLSLQFEKFNQLFNCEYFYKNKENEGLYKILTSIFPISNQEEDIKLCFVDYKIEPPKYSYIECIENSISYACDLTIRFRLEIKQSGKHTTKTEQNIYMGSIPIMTQYGTFIHNGIERVCVSQLQKTIGLSFFCEDNKNILSKYTCRIIPLIGSWIEFIISTKETMLVCFDKKNKFYITTLLRAIGYEKDEDILSLFKLIDGIKCEKDILKKNINRTIAVDVIKTEHNTNKEDTNNNIIVSKGTVLNDEIIDKLIKENIKTIFVFKKNSDIVSKYSILINTLNKDPNKNTEEAAAIMFKSFYPQKKCPQGDILKKIIEDFFFNKEKYDLGEIGRKKINAIVDTCYDTTALTKNDLINIITHFFKIINKEQSVSDVDHYGNKRIYTVGDQLYDQLQNIFFRIAKQVRIKMDRITKEKATIFDFIPIAIFTSQINSFFGLNPFMQFMDEMNPLAEIMHKRRVSVIGVNGVSRDSKTTNIRDIHYSQYGKLCPIETPEGNNIGLITSIAMNAKLNNDGFILSPFRKVKNGVIDLKDEDIVFMDANEESNKKISLARIKYDTKGKILTNKAMIRYGNNFQIRNTQDIEFVEASTNQPFSVAASMIPFLENDDSGRAMMGINMQKQSIPLLCAEIPIVATGIEKKICHDCKNILYAKNDGIVKYADANKIIVEYDLTEEEKLCSFELETEYDLIKMKKSNQKTAINYTPLVKTGQKIKKGDVLTEGFSTKNGEIALGVNLKVAFMTWEGYNYEDAIIISDRLIKDDVLTSIFIEKYNITSKYTTVGKEEITKELNNITDYTMQILDDDGLVKEGAFVKSGDILVGKTVPIATQNSVTEENRILKSIFGEKACASIDKPLVVPPFVNGTVIKAKLFQKSQDSKNTKKDKIEKLKNNYGEKINCFINLAYKKFYHILKNETTEGVFYKDGTIILKKNEKFTEENLWKILTVEKNYEDIDNNFFNEYENLIFFTLLPNIKTNNWTKNAKVNSLIELLIKNTLTKQNEILHDFYKELYVIKNGDILLNSDNILKKAEITIAQKRKIKEGDKLSGRHGNKGVIAKINREEDMPFLEDGSRVDIILTPLGIPPRMNIGQLYESILALAGKKMNCKYETPIFNGYDIESIADEISKAQLPNFCKMQLFDGLTGEKFEQKCTVGIIYMLKLNHMVDDKIHARSIGKYSVISQQPLGGRVNFGGQRFGEMEVWAFEAYGVANILQEMMTIKSDDVKGRTKTFESIIHGQQISLRGETESFFVLTQILKAIGLKLTYK